MLRRVMEWLEERTGIESALKHFLYEDIPASSGWHQVLGSVAMFAFLTQVVTGILLALNYAPTPGDAWASLRYIMVELTGGPLIRGLHHWGASLMIIVVVLHMAQVFLWGAYKKPREATWLVGCVLLLVTLAYGLTGYLLPWDNRAYWGTVVTTQITAQAPGAGPYLLRLLGSDGGSIGVVTFARFYSAHVLLLPPLTMLLIAVHLILVRRHGVAPEPSDEGKPKKKFFPEQVYKDTVATFLWFAILVGMAIFAKVPLGRVADPTDTSFIPRPEWYFLFLFQTLKLFEGPLEIVGSVILPTLAIVALLLVPFIDRGRMIKIRQRTGAIGLVVLGVLGWSGLTARAIATTPPGAGEDDSGLMTVETWQQIPAENLAAIGYFRKDNCTSCHELGKSGKGPDLSGNASTRMQDWLLMHFKMPGAGDATKLKDPELQTLATFVTTRKAPDVEAWKNAPQPMVDAAVLYMTNDCGSCHMLNGTGQDTGPAINGLAQRRTKDWVKQHFAEPEKLSPGSLMPDFHFEQKDLENISSYLMAIPK